jgi:pimeloyl-ACP methyl ester carboxylesterase
MPYVPVQGTRFYYTEAGPSTGRPVLLLHAALQTSASMEPLIRLMSPLGLRMAAPDQRGHGRSANPGRTLQVPQLADDMVALMGKLGLVKPILVGYSLGGIVAIELARRGLASALLVLASRIHPAERGPSAFDPAHIRERTPLWAKQLAVKHEEMSWDELSVELGQMLETWSGFSTLDLASIGCPTLVVQGDQDEMVPIEQARELAATIPGARFYEVPRAKHPELLYRQDAMREVEQFVANLKRHE